MKRNLGDNIDDQNFKLIIKAKDKGMLEALTSQILKVIKNYDSSRISILSSGLGNLTDTDLKEAALYKARIYGMDLDISFEIER